MTKQEEEKQFFETIVEQKPSRFSMNDNLHLMVDQKHITNAEKQFSMTTSVQSYQLADAKSELITRVNYTDE